MKNISMKSASMKNVSIRKIVIIAMASLLIPMPFTLSEKPLSIDKLSIVREGKYCEIVMDDVLYLYKEGYPILPYKVYTYTYPAGTEIKNIEVKVKNIEKIKLQSKIKPAPPAVPLNMKNIRVEAKEGEIYEKDEFYPEKWYDYKIHAGIKDGKHVIFLSIYLFPCRYNAVRDELLYCDDFDVGVSYACNPTIFTADEYDLLIIAPDGWTDELQALKEHKEMQEIRTMIMETDDIYKTYRWIGRDYAERIKYAIKDAVEQYGIKYVLLVGDAEVMPVRYVSTVIGDVPSDLYYSDIYYSNYSFSSWDRDKDKVYGERRDDKPDLYPDVYVARLPASTPSELEDMIQKIVEYEAPPMKAIMIGTELFWDTPEREGEYLKEQISNSINLETVKLYETQDYARDAPAYAYFIAEYINDGALFVNFASHGNPQGMGWESGGFGIHDLALLSNEYLPIVFAMACSTNQFDGGDCLGEMFLLVPERGAIAYVGSSRVAYVYLGNGIDRGLSGYLDKMFFKAYYDGSNNIGEIFSTAKANYLSTLYYRDNHDWLTIFEFNLLGDPSIEIPSMPLTSKAYTSKEVSNTSIKVRAEATENATLDLYYRKKIWLGGKWNFYESASSPPYEWEFLPEEEGYYEFCTIMRKNNYTEDFPVVADAFCLFDFTPPSMEIKKPKKGGIYFLGREIMETDADFAIIIGRIEVEVEGDFSEVEFYLDNNLIFTADEPPYKWMWKDFSIGFHEIKIIAYDEAENKAEEAMKVFSVIL